MKSLSIIHKPHYLWLLRSSMGGGGSSSSNWWWELFLCVCENFDIFFTSGAHWTMHNAHEDMQTLFLSLDFAPKVRSVLDEHWSRTRLLGKQSEAAWTWLLDLHQVILNVKAFPKLLKISLSSRGISGLPQQWSVPAPKVVAIFYFWYFSCFW